MVLVSDPRLLFASVFHHNAHKPCYHYNRAMRKTHQLPMDQGSLLYCTFNKIRRCTCLANCRPEEVLLAQTHRNPSGRNFVAFACEFHHACLERSCPRHSLPSSEHLIGINEVKSNQLRILGQGMHARSPATLTQAYENIIIRLPLPHSQAKPAAVCCFIPPYSI